MKKIHRSLLRADLHRLLAAGFDSPSRQNQKEIVSLVGDLLEGPPYAVLQTSLKQGLKSLLSALKKAPLSLESEFNRLFVNQVDCPHCEGSYLLAERGTILGDVTAFYRAFHIRVLPMEGPPDAAKMELAFLSLMALKEGHAMENGLAEEADITHKAQRRFLEDHLGRWGLPLAERLRNAAQIPFYKRLADLLEIWMEMECCFFGLPRTIIGACAAPSSGKAAGASPSAPFGLCESPESTPA